MLKGGKAPRLCEEKFTSRALAVKALHSYIAKGDKLGFAQYPDKED